MSISKLHSKPFLDSEKEQGEEKNKVVGGTLYLVGTPIGNLGDITYRQVKVLSEVDFVAAEDTRNSGRLLNFLNIKKPFVSYHEHNLRQKGYEIAERLLAGESCALITDAGMPAISDPGADLVSVCIKKNIPVTAVPGPCALIDALVLSGMDTGRFSFEGFLSTAGSPRKKHLSSCEKEERTMIFYEAPHKLKKTLADFETHFGPDRKIALCRELTKINEEINRTTVSEAIAEYENKEPRGEYVLVVDGYRSENDENFDPLDGMNVEERVAFHEKSGLSHMDAIKATAKELGVGKREIYDIMQK